MKKLVYIILLLVTTVGFSQSNPITYQAVIYLPSGQNAPGVDVTNLPMTNKNICLQFSFIDANNRVEYQEEIKVKTDEFGMVNITIGNGEQSGGYASSFDAIVWNALTQKNLQVALDATGLCNQFEALSNEPIASVPFANASITAGNVSGIVALVNGGTGATTAAGARSNLGIGNVENTADLNKPMSTATKTYVDTAIAGITIEDANATTKGKIQLAGDLAGTAEAPTVPGLALKLDASLVGVPNGLATLNSAGIIPANQLPPISVASTNVVANQAQMLALSNATVGSIAVRTDLNKNFILSTAGPSVLANWIELLTPGAPVQSVNGLTGAIQLAKSDINLANVDNTSDAAKPVSTATQNALNLKLNTNQVGVPNGTASLNALGKIPTSQIPAISFSSVKVLGSQAEMLALVDAVVGSVVIRTDVNKNYVLAQSNPQVLANWVELLTPAPPVQSVNGYVGSVALTKSDIGLSNADNTGDIDKPVSTATQTALDLKANLASPTFTGTVGGITKSMVGLANVDNTTDLNKPVSTATQSALDLKANLASPTFSGTVSGITKAMVGLGNVDNTTDLNKPISTATQTALNLKANTADVTTSLALKEDVANKSTTTTLGTSDLLYPSQKAVKTYVDTAIAGATIVDADSTTKGKLKLAGDLAGTADLPEVAAGAISTAKLATNAVTTAKITDANVTTAKLADDAVTTIKITDANVTTAKLAPNAVTTVKITDANVTNAKLDKANIPLSGFGAAAADVALGANKLTGVADPAAAQDAATKNYVDVAIAGATIADANATTKGKLKLAGDLAGTADLPEVAAGAISNAKLATNAVTTAKILNANVTDAKLDKANIPLSGFGAATADVALGANKLTGVADPAAAQDAATKNYVDTAISSSSTTAVPYTGATGPVNLGAYNLTVNGMLIGRPANSFATQVQNTALGVGVMSSYLPTALAQDYNTGIGYYALNKLTTGARNTATGSTALYNLTTGNYNSAFGMDALSALTTGGYNTGIGIAAGKNIQTTSHNTMLGYYAGLGITGSNNIVIGSSILPTTGTGITTGSNNTIIGSGINSLTSTLSNNIVLADGQGNIRAQHNGSTGWTLGTIISGTWNAATIAIDKGGTGATTAADALTNLGAEPTANKSTAIDLGNNAPSNVLFPSQAAVKAYVDSSVSSGAPDATTTTKGKIKLAGDLTNTADLPRIAALAISTAKLADDAVTSAKITDETILVDDLANAAVETAKIKNANVTYAKIQNVAADKVLGRVTSGAGVVEEIATTGTGDVVRATSPILVTPDLGAATATSVEFTGATSGTATIAAPAVAGTTAITLPAASGTLATLDGTETLTNKTLTGPTMTAPVLGTPVSGTLTNATGLPIATGVSGLGTGVATALATPSSANLLTAVTDETGTGALVFATSPTLVTPDLGTPSAIDLTNATGLPIATAVTGILPGTNGGTGVNNGTKTITLGGNLTTSGAFATILTSTAATTVTLPTTGTLATLAGTETLTNKTLTSPTLTTPDLGVATATSINGLTPTALATGFTIAGGSTTSKTLTVSGDATVSGTTSGTNTGDQTITLTGDVTGSGTGSFAATIGTGKVTTSTIAADAITSAKIADATIVVGDLAADAVETAKIKDANVTYAKIQNVSATDKVLGRVSTGAGVIEEIATTGSGNVVRATSPTLVTPDLGTPSAIDLTNATGLPIATAVTGILPGTNGGTGVNNGTKTITLGGNLTTSGAFATTLTSTAATTVTLPTTGTLATLAGTETLTNKTLTSPTLTTPALGVATATSINGTSIPSSKTLVVTTDKISALSATTSAELAGVISDETGSGSLVMATSPTLVTPTLGVATATSVGFSGATSGTATLAAPAVAGTTTITLPAATGTLATLAGTETLTNKTLTSPTLTTPDLGVATATSINGLTPTALATGFTIAGGSTTSKTLTVSGDATVSGTTSGTNTGDQTITLTGDVTGSGTGSFAATIGTGKVTTSTIAADAITSAKIADATIVVGDLAADAVETAKIKDANVTYAKIQNVSATDKVLGRVSSGAGVIEEIATTGSGNVVRATSPTLVTPVIGAATGTSLSVSGQLTSTVATGTAPLVVTSTTPVANLSIGGTAATATNIAGGAAGSIPYQTAAATTAMLAKGTDGQVLTLASGAPSWASPAGITTLAAIGSTPNANGATISGSTLNLEPASASFGGIVNTTTQTFAGAKTFNADILTNGVRAGRGVAGIISNTVLGRNALGGTSVASNENSFNTAIGNSAMQNSDGTGSYNTAVGANSAFYNNSGSHNTYLGYQSGYYTTSGTKNVAIGSGALYGSTTGNYLSGAGNNAIGFEAMKDISTTAADNIAIGLSAGTKLTTGTKNIFIGSLAGSSISTGSTANTTGLNSVLIGYDVRPLANADTNEIVLSGYNGTAGTVGLGSNTTLIGNSTTTNARIMGALNLPNTTASTSSSTGALTVGGGAGIAGAIYAGSIQNTPIGSTTASTGAFTTLAASGNATVAGTLAVTGATTLSSTLGVSGDVAVNTDKFKIAASSGNTEIAGTIKIAGGTPGAGKVLVSDANGLASWSSNSNGGASLISATATMAATATYNLIVFSGSTASQTITLPSATDAGAGREITIKNIASVPVTINATAGNLISDSTTTGATSLSIGIEPSNNWIKAISTGSNWIILRGLF